MPNCVAHALCGEVALNGDYDHLRAIIDKNKAAFFLGCQGPDFLMYYRILPWQKQKGAKRIREIADDIHDHKINEFFKNLLEETSKRKNEALIAYTAGFLCHHSLDSIAHPMIFYFTDSVNGNIGYAHQMYESQLDIGILQAYKLTTKDYRIDKRIMKIKQGKDIIAQVMNKVIKETYDIDVSELQLKECLDNMAHVVKILTDTNGRRYRSIEKLENIFQVKGMGTSMMVPTDYDNKLDAMNYRGSKWYYPADKSITSNSDFTQLFSQAIQETRDKFSLLDRLVNGQDVIEDLLKVINDRGFCTGLSSEPKMYYFYKDHKQDEVSL